MKKIDKSRGGLLATQIKGNLVPTMQNGKIFHWVPLLDLQAADLHVVTRRHIAQQLADGLVPIMASPCLSDQTTAKNRCATVLKTKVHKDIVYGLLMPGGNKKKIFNQMIKDGFPIIATLVGSGEFVNNTVDRGRLVINSVHYFRLDFIK